MLQKQGITLRQQQNLLQQGKIWRVRHGWYASTNANPDAVRAVKAGGQLGCISGCQLYGLWIPPGSAEKLHVSRRGMVRGITTETAEFHYLCGSLRSPLASLEECLLDVCRFHEVETGMIVLESAMNQKFLDLEQAHILLERLSAPKHETYHFLSDQAESGSETRVRYFLEKLGVAVHPQRIISGIGRVDLLVGKSLIIECDSRAHHTADENYHRDRERDIVAQMLGYRVIRLSFRHIWFDWAQTQAFLKRTLQTRRHRKDPRPL